MVRRPVAVIAALVLMVEAVGIVLLHLFLGMVVDEQQMSLAGIEPRSMELGTVIGGIFFGTVLLLAAAVLLVMAIRDRPPGRMPRILLIAIAVVHGLLGAFSVGMVGWAAFGFMMVVLGMFVWSLLAFGRTEHQRIPDREADDGAGSTGSTGSTGPAAGPDPLGA